MVVVWSLRSCRKGGEARDQWFAEQFAGREVRSAELASRLKQQIRSVQHVQSQLDLSKLHSDSFLKERGDRQTQKEI